MKYILPLHGISIRSHLLTVKLLSSQQVRFLSAFPRARSRELPRIMEKFLFAAEVAIPEQQPIQMNLIGKLYIVV